MSNAKKKINHTYLNQINVLKILSQNGVVDSEPRPFQINEIADLSGLKDERETQRYLFILEGQKLVSPFPAGDFTSRSWHITKHGLKTLKSISLAMV
jgi:hypothetical protein